MAQVTDEMVEKARKAEAEAAEDENPTFNSMRAALESVADDLRAEGMIDTREALENLVRAWDALPGGRHYRPSEIATWLHEEMSPAINRARAMLSPATQKETA